ncbi:DNA polymerase [Gallid alphaherpesvirus 3]|uniref:DNA polymerase n=1 Tax=Gallid alphaherpesvirus 3 TaxID=35250 RepID=F8TC32_9ALPH|nr:DNA polymerase [Gallid alphaherpesvirus 3]AEI00243.1 DNA polymerase [Gallid alphaherpesvirus 3]QEY02277.1 DNA polymerase [Gallid alphaherpesvirus 3]
MGFDCELDGCAGLDRMFPRTALLGDEGSANITSGGANAKWSYSPCCAGLPTAACFLPPGAVEISTERSTGSRLRSAVITAGDARCNKGDESRRTEASPPKVSHLGLDALLGRTRAAPLSEIRPIESILVPARDGFSALIPIPPSSSSGIRDFVEDATTNGVEVESESDRCGMFGVPCFFLSSRTELSEITTAGDFWSRAQPGALHAAAVSVNFSLPR